jgi:hypothetical protein
MCITIDVLVRKLDFNDTYYTLTDTEKDLLEDNVDELYEIYFFDNSKIFRIQENVVDSEICVSYKQDHNTDLTDMLKNKLSRIGKECTKAKLFGSGLEYLNTVYLSDLTEDGIVAFLGDKNSLKDRLKFFKAEIIKECKETHNHYFLKSKLLKGYLLVTCMLTQAL